MATALGFQGAILGIGEEVTYGTKVTVTKFMELNSDGLTVSEERLHSGAIPSIYSDDSEVCQSAISVSGDLSMEMRHEGMEMLLKHAMGTSTIAEVDSFIVGATNNKLNFNIGALELTATIASSTYIAGASQLTAGSLCKAIFDAIVSAEGTGTYTVVFSTTTNKFTIARTAGTFQILWKTGTNGSDGTDTHIGTLLGYADTADDTGALTYTSDTASVQVYDNTFTLADALPTGLTLEVDRDLTAFTVEGGKINTMGMSIDSAGFLMLNLGIIGEDMTQAAATSPTLPTSSLACFVTGVVKYATVTTQVKSFSFTLNNQLGTDRRFIGSRMMSEPQRTAKREVTGTMSLEFDTVDKYNDFRNMTSVALQLIFTTTTFIKGTLPYVITINFPIVKFTGGVPTVSNAGVVMVDMPFKAYALDSTQYEMNIVVRNSKYSI